MKCEGKKYCGTVGGYSNKKCRGDNCRLRWNAYCAGRGRERRMIEKLNAPPKTDADSKLTGSQFAVLKFVHYFIVSRQYPPTCREIADHFGWSSANAASESLSILNRKGVIERPKGGARTMRITDAGRECAENKSLSVAA